VPLLPAPPTGHSIQAASGDQTHVPYWPPGWFRVPLPAAFQLWIADCAPLVANASDRPDLDQDRGLILRMAVIVCTT
jgi:hypothetical protein